MSPQPRKGRGGDGNRRPTPGGGRGKSFGEGKKRTPKPQRREDTRGGGSGSGSGRGPAPQRSTPAPHAHDEPRPRGDLIYGRNPVHEALRAGRREVKRVWATQAASGESWLSGVSVKLLDTDELTEKVGTDSHQGIVAQVGQYPYVEPEELLADPDALIVALDEVQDPQNLGAIARSAEAAGATGLVILERRSAEVTAAAAKASAGAVEHLRIARARNLADLLTEAKEEGFWVYGADGTSPVPYTQIAYDGRVILVLGAEGKGIRPRVRSLCDQLVALPLRGRIESLNVSATAAVLLYEAVRTRTS